jgi:hypothetical protein
MTPPSDKAMQAAKDHLRGRTLRGYGELEEGARVLHDRALGLDRSVCLRDVVEWLRRPEGGKFSFGDANADAIEREFGA